MRFPLATAVTFAVLFMFPSPGRALALTIAETALAECGVKTSVAVVDRTGRLRVFLQGDGASPHNLELARRKAYTALTFGRTSAEWAQRTDQSRRGNNWRRRPERSRDGRGAGGGLCQGRHCQGSRSTSVRLAATCLAAQDFDLKSPAPLAFAWLGQDFHCGPIAAEWS
jgi:hypothetical protein